MLPAARKKLLAALAGVVLAGTPMLAFHYWLNGAIERQGWEEVDSAARRTIALAEARLDRVIAGLDELSRREIDTCRGAHLDTLRQVTFAITPIKEFSIVASDGHTTCSDGGLPLAPRMVVASQRVSPAGVVLIELVRIGDYPEPALRVRRPGPRATLAALVPTDLLMLQVSSQGDAFDAYARLSLQDGTVVRSLGTEPPARDRTHRLVTTQRSARYGLVAMVSMAPAASDNAADLRTLGLIITAVVALLLLAFAVLVPWRAKGNPIDEIRRALEAGEFVPFYQPIVDIKSGQLRGAEVLIRWRRPDGSMVLPGAFIPLAESSGLIIELTRALMRRACEEVGPAFSRRRDLKIAFNLAARHFADENVVSDVREVFERSKVKLSQVVLELTERQPLDDLTETRRVIAALQGIGVRIAIDDVGTGHSGLSYLLKLGVDIIKIDKMFVDAIADDRNSGTIIETLVELARNMRMEIVAEGVENFEQVVRLRDLGIRQAQGYVFAPPLPGTSFLRLVEATVPPAADGAAPRETAAAG